MSINLVILNIQIANPKKCSCTECNLKDVESLCTKFCPLLFEKIKSLKPDDPNFQVHTKYWEKKENETSKSKYDLDDLRCKTVDVLTFLEDFFHFLTKKRGYIWHYYLYNLQNYHYKEMIKKMKRGDYGDSAMMLVLDWAYDWTIKKSKKVYAREFFKTEKLQILGITEFSFLEKKFDGCSNFFMSHQKIKKNAPNSIADLAGRILEAKKKNKNLKIVHLWSDGATNEFMNRKMFGNLQHITDLTGVIIVWNFFCSHHGKAICDSEFARFKTKLDTDFVGRYHEFVNEKVRLPAEGIYNFCDVVLRENWECNGNLIKSRDFHLRPFDEPLFDDYKPVKDTNLSRCYMWDENRNFYRKCSSCSCVDCVLSPSQSTSCKFSNLTGIFKIYKMKPVIISQN